MSEPRTVFRIELGQVRFMRVDHKVFECERRVVPSSQTAEAKANSDRVSEERDAFLKQLLRLRSSRASISKREVQKRMKQFRTHLVHKRKDHFAGMTALIEAAHLNDDPRPVDEDDADEEKDNWPELKMLTDEIQDCASTACVTTPIRKQFFRTVDAAIKQARRELEYSSPIKPERDVFMPSIGNDIPALEAPNYVL